VKTTIWLISTPGRRGRLRTLLEDLDYEVLAAPAVKIRADLIDSVTRAAQDGAAPVVIDGPALEMGDLKAAIEKVRSVNSEVALVVIISEGGDISEAAAGELSLSGAYSLLRDDADLKAKLDEGIKNPQSLAKVKEAPKRGLFKKTKAAEAEAVSSEKSQTEDLKKKYEQQPQPKTQRSLLRRALYVFADNIKVVIFSLLLTAAVMVLYFAVSQKGLTLGEISSFFGRRLIKPFEAFFRK